MSQDAMVSEVLVGFDCFVKDVQGGRNHFGIQIRAAELGGLLADLLFPLARKYQESDTFPRQWEIEMLGKIPKKGTRLDNS